MSSHNLPRSFLFESQGAWRVMNSLAAYGSDSETDTNDLTAKTSAASTSSPFSSEVAVYQTLGLEKSQKDFGEVTDDLNKKAVNNASKSEFILKALTSKEFNNPLYVQKYVKHFAILEHGSNLRPIT